MNEPRVSFIVPSYNYAEFVGCAIDSLASQTYRSLEVIVIDDASSDGTRDVLRRYAEDPRIRIVHHDVNRGHIRSYNEGIALARGELIGLLSADDLCLRTDAVERQVATFDTDPGIGFVYSACAFADEEGSVQWVKRPWPDDYVRSGPEEFCHLVFHNYVPASGTLVRRRCHEMLGGYDVRLPHAGDWDLWLRISTRFSVGYIAEPLYAWRIHHRNMHHQTATVVQATDEHLLTVRKAFDALPASAPPAAHRLRKRALRHAILRGAANECVSGRRARGWRGLWDVTRRFPGSVTAPAYHLLVAKLLMLTLLGYPRCVQIAGWRSRWSRGRVGRGRHAS